MIYEVSIETVISRCPSYDSIYIFSFNFLDFIVVEIHISWKNGVIMLFCGLYKRECDESKCFIGKKQKTCKHVVNTKTKAKKIWSWVCPHCDIDDFAELTPEQESRSFTFIVKCDLCHNEIEIEVN